MGVREDLNEVKDKIKEIRKENEENSFAMELLKGYKTANRRLFIIILVILSFWFATIGAFVYYINTTGYEEIITETAETDDGGNACVGDNCNNGDIYGESK